MLGFYETEKRIKTQMRLEKGSVHKSVLVFASDQKSRKMINIYLKLYGYEEVCVQIIRKVDPADMGEIVRMIDQHHPQEVIVLYAGEFSWSIELQHYFFDRILERGVNITSIYDRLTVHADQYYLRMIEKRELISRSMLQKREDSREQIKRSMFNDNRGKRVAAYLRVSSREQTLGYSIENQREKISMYLELFEYEDVKIDFFVDSGRSASSLKRPQLQEMLKRIKNDEYDEVIVYKLDRLTRNVIDVYHLLQMFLEMDVNLIAILDNLDIKTANGRLLVGMLAIIAQWERETIVERTNDGLMQMALEGKYPIKGFPFGYYKDEKNFLYIDPKTKPIVRLIFRLAQRGHIYTEIVYKVKEEYDISLRPEYIKKILFHPGYYGKFTYKNIVFQDVMPAIVTEEEAKEAQRIFGMRGVYGKEQNKFIYRHKVYCEKCDKMLYGIPTYKVNKRYYYYYCKECRKRVNQELLIERTLLPMLKRKKDVDEKAELERSQKIVHQLSLKAKKVTRDYAAGMLDDQIYTGIIAELEKKMRSERNKARHIKIENDISWEKLSDDAKRGIIESSITEIKVDLNEKRIRVKYIDEEK